MDNLTYVLADILALIRSKKADLASAQASCRALTGLEGIKTNPPAAGRGVSSISNKGELLSSNCDGVYQYAVDVNTNCDGVTSTGVLNYANEVGC